MAGEGGHARAGLVTSQVFPTVVSCVGGCQQCNVIAMSKIIGCNKSSNSWSTKIRCSTAAQNP